MAAGADYAGGPSGGGLLSYVEALVAETVDLGPPTDTAGPASPPAPLRAKLHLVDLVSDAASETVLLAGEGVDGLTLVITGEAVTARGAAAQHLTAGGEDVSGHSYVSFASGPQPSTTRPGSTSRSPTCDLRGVSFTDRQSGLP
jgi:hypothetical protein